MAAGRLQSLSSELTLQKIEQTLREDWLALQDGVPSPGLTTEPGDELLQSMVLGRVWTRCHDYSPH